MSERVHATFGPAPGAARADAETLLDAMEQATGLRGERDGDRRRYVIEAADPAALTGQIVDNLPPGWQDVLTFEV